MGGKNQLIIRRAADNKRCTGKRKKKSKKKKKAIQEKHPVSTRLRRNTCQFSLIFEHLFASKYLLNTSNGRLDGYR